MCNGNAQGIDFDFVRGTALNEPTLTEHAAMHWVSPREMLHYPFCPADTAVAEQLALNDPPLKSILWDLDGTLMDTYPRMTDCLHRVCLELGADIPPERLLALQKDSLTHAVQVLGAELGTSSEKLLARFREL